MPDFSLPRWLEPPNEAEKARIDEAKDAASKKAASMMSRAIGMRRMQADAQAAVANGVDPITAKQNALFNNAHLLFADNPEAVNQLTESQAANQSRQRALLQSQAALAVTANHYSNLADEAKARLAETTKYHQAELDRKSKADALKASGGDFTPSIIPVMNPLTGKPIAVLRRGPKSSEMVETKPSSKLSEVDKAELSSTYKRINALQAAHDTLVPESGDVEKHPNTITRMHLSQEITKLRSRAKELEGKPKATSDTSAPTATETPATDTPAAKPTPALKLGAMVEQGGKRYRYRGGDVNDPASYVEAQ